MNRFTVHNTESFSVEEGLKFILGHLSEPLWPRTIMTPLTHGQLTVTNEVEALHYFRRADYIDCRISAYPKLVDYCGINRQAPTIFMIDLDRCHFKSDAALNKAVSFIVKNIADVLDGRPTVLFTGRGYHIYQPLEAFIMEQTERFARFKLDTDLSTAFMRFAASRLSRGKHDPANTQSLRNCMLRIPGSFNAKCITTGTVAEIGVVQPWNKIRPQMTYMIGDFYAYLVDIDRQRRHQQSRLATSNSGMQERSLPWIEGILDVGIADHRKYTINLILVPYLLNVRNFTEGEIVKVVDGWLLKCSTQRALDFDPKYIIRCAIRNARKGYKPMKRDTLKDRNPDLHGLLDRIATKDVDMRHTVEQKS